MTETVHKNFETPESIAMLKNDLLVSVTEAIENERAFVISFVDTKDDVNRVETSGHQIDENQLLSCVKSMIEGNEYVRVRIVQWLVVQAIGEL